MNSFQVRAIGNLAKTPELTIKDGTTLCRFVLIGNDYAGRDDSGESREVVSSMQFVAFGTTAEAIANHSRKGDQLIVDAHIRTNRWTDRETGEERFDNQAIVDTFRFGAPGQLSRARLAQAS